MLTDGNLSHNYFVYMGPKKDHIPTVHTTIVCASLNLKHSYYKKPKRPKKQNHLLHKPPMDRPSWV